MTVSTERGVALVTGASGGIGAVYARKLAARGYDVVLVARDTARLTALAGEIAADTGRAAEAVTADLTDRADLARIEARLQSDPTITLLVNNAGFALSGPIAAADADATEQMIALNVVALTRLTLAVLPGFVARDAGTIVNIGSIVPFIPERFPGVYGSTKAFVQHFTQSLDAELKGTAIRVQAVLPGATATEIWDKSGIGLANLPPEIVMPVDAMVDAALAGLDRGELVTIPALPEIADWEAFERARLALAPNLSRREAAPRYRATASAAA